MRYWYDEIQFENLVSCVLSGLVSTTCACFTIQPWEAIIFGIISAIFFFISSYFVEKKLKLDDPLRITSVHFGSGFVGLILEGILADQRSYHPGLIHGGYSHFFIQIAGACSIALFLIFANVFIWKVLLEKVFFRNTGLKVGALHIYLVKVLFFIFFCVCVCVCVCVF